MVEPDGGPGVRDGRFLRFFIENNILLGIFSLNFCFKTYMFVEYYSGDS